MRLAINNNCAFPGGGITHLKNLILCIVQKLGEARLLLIGGPVARDRLGLPQSAEWVSHMRDPTGLVNRIVWENTELPALLKREKADVVFHPANFGPFRSPVPVVTVVHNIAPFLSTVKSRGPLAQRVRLEILRHLTLRSLATSDTTDLVIGFGIFLW